MEQSVLGIHHVTAITGEPQPNIDFYAGVLGLRFVKKTVNFDVPDTYHFYYGDDLGSPGTILTFFSWPDAPQGLRGTGQVSTIAFSVPTGALPYWQERLFQHGVQVEHPLERFGQQVLPFRDHEDLALELVAHPGAEQGKTWQDGPVPSAYALRGFYGVTLSVTRTALTTALLSEQLGFQHTVTEGQRSRFTAGHAGSGHIVDVLDLSGASRGREAIGTVHHVAFRTADDEQQLAWRQKLISAGLDVTPVRDRSYFHSIYFREPSGVLFEIATDQPGFAIDEVPAELGTHLKLPAQYEPYRAQLERSLPPVHLPGQM